jgi:hypothetical protein
VMVLCLPMKIKGCPSNVFKSLSRYTHTGQHRFDTPMTLLLYIQTIRGFSRAQKQTTHSKFKQHIFGKAATGMGCKTGFTMTCAFEAIATTQGHVCSQALMQ